LDVGKAEWSMERTFPVNLKLVKKGGTRFVVISVTFLSSCDCQTAGQMYLPTPSGSLVCKFLWWSHIVSLCLLHQTKSHQRGVNLILILFIVVSFFLLVLFITIALTGHEEKARETDSLQPPTITTSAPFIVLLRITLIVCFLWENILCVIVCCKRKTFRQTEHNIVTSISFLVVASHVSSTTLWSRKVENHKERSVEE